MEAPDHMEETQAPQELKRKEQHKGTVMKITLAGAIVDIGAETPGIVHISRLQKEPVNRVEDVVKVGQEVDVWVRRVDSKTGRIDLTMIEPLELEWRDIKQGMQIKGKITRLESFGAFVEIGAERPGLVHISEMSNEYVRNPQEVVKEGDEVDVHVIGVNRRKKRIRLSMKSPEAGTTGRPAERERDSLPEETMDEPTPTAMEIAYREAMERSKETKSPAAAGTQTGAAKPKRGELDELLSRTLENKRE
jgi:ribosomal protein S1